MELFDRNTLLKSLESHETWDLVVIGGGATGLGIAVDGATRGYKTLLVEQADFAKGTSSRSTKLVHGGVRYLAQGDIGLVREALKERGRLLQNAPHLTRNESIIIPCYSFLSAIKYTVGLKLYDALAGRLSFGKSMLIKKTTLSKRLPTVQKHGLTCGVLYHDGTFDDARLALNLAQTAVEYGGTCLNYMRVTSLSKNKEGKINGLVLTDQLTGIVHPVKASSVVNATGVFADEILHMDNAGAKTMIRPSQGIHLVLDKKFLNSKTGIMIPKTEDGRVLFVLPWFDKVLMGTTDTPLNAHSLEPRALEEEIEFILKTAGKYLEIAPARSDVQSVYAGLRPLAATSDQSDKTKEISRSHKVLVAESGLVSIVGGKWTTYRKMAEDTIGKMIQEGLLPEASCKTVDLPIHGAAPLDDSGDPLSGYGSDKKLINAFIESLPELAKPVAGYDRLLTIQVIWAVRYEMAHTIEDLLARRTRLLFTDAKKAIELAGPVAQIMATELDKDQKWIDAQVAEFTSLAKGYLLT
ncbi:glycerol-3-phosphate dehydrogenase [Arachidicoccus rhizosphaerae]|uniref:Glycerol-3-phosphate dehydrogenase n=1 Tax=Arachidicoccus rhizosphaerae TaxID=551991 RepID=A0A1H4C8B6_9BACT|nr:glycerol-3-phosphate dehydrogenase/oxidase [Arachidicoccus rhizosphaerae]SEA56322.1 glycerol-3-phosphate dehydrogenase [Arachidicoccus rhizosphaerae]